MRTHVAIDDELMKSALEVSGLKTKKAVIEEALRLLMQVSKQKKIRQYRGKLMWPADLEDIRLD